MLGPRVLCAGDPGYHTVAPRDILERMDALVELLDRQVDFLLRQTDSAAFLIQVEPFLGALRTEPRLAAYLDDVVDEVVEIIEAMETVDAELTAELVELRRELVELRPDADDSDAQAPSESDSAAVRSQERSRYTGTLAHFDEWAASEPEAFNADGTGGKAKTLLGILQRRAEPDEDGPEPDRLDAWRRRLGNVQRRYDYAVRLLRLRTRTSPGLALVRLEAVPDELNPPPRIVADGRETLREASDVSRWMSSESYSLFKLAWQDSLDSGDVSVIDRRVDDLRDAVERLHEELRRRIGTTRSRLALVNRFKLRCEWHDRERILAVADDDRLPGGPEDRLTSEFARYLFDAGLSPLTKPLAEGLQPDLLDPLASFYVEAKQFGSSSARADIVNGVKQVLDTVGGLRGGPYAVDEAFCVVFRRDGPYYALPELLQMETYRLHLVLVDLAPSTQVGQRQPAPPVQIPIGEFSGAAPGEAT